MAIREIKNSGAFIVTVFVLVVVLLPFGLEQIGSTTGLYKFPFKKKVSGWFTSSSDQRQQTFTSKAVDWERYRQDIESFCEWIGERDPVRIAPPPTTVEIVVKEEIKKPERKIWPVPVVSCTSGDSIGRSKGYVFISGFASHYDEGSIIAPSEKLCGYEIVSIGDGAVWFRAVFESEGDVPMGIVKFPSFSRIEGDALVRGARKYVARDAFKLESGGWMMIDSFIRPDTAVFKILDENRNVVSTILCVIIGETRR